MSNILRNLPSVSQLLDSPQLKKMVETINHGVVADGVRTFLDDLRSQVTDAADDIPIPTPTEMADKIANWLSNEERPYLRPVINGTGIILHTGLGRAPLAKEAIEQVTAIAESSVTMEPLAYATKAQEWIETTSGNTIDIHFPALANKITFNKNTEGHVGLVEELLTHH